MTPQDRHQHFFQQVNPQLAVLGRLICDASGIDDQVLMESRYQDLVAFYDEQVTLGCWHPGLTETLADFTACRDAAAALPYYRLALTQAEELKSSACTILISMAKALFQTGQRTQAEARLREAREAAFAFGDEECVQEADRVFREASAE